MILSREEERVLSGEEGEARAKAMEILCAVGKIYGADGLLPVSSAQVSGVSYKTIGDAGLEFLADFAAKGAKAAVPSFLNPAGMDRENWKAMGVPPAFAEKQLEILRAYGKMGVSATCTCAPYLIGIRPRLGEHVAWSESNAISFANSMLGARTNRESGVTALASAITGKTPNFGLHLDENRKAGLIVEVDAEMGRMTDFGALGLIAGREAKDRIPAFEGIPRKPASEDRMKSLGAAMAASGSVALYYAKGITPEWRLAGEPGKLESIAVTKRELEEEKAKMSSADSVELVTIGCPHASLSEVREVAGRVKGKKLKVSLWVCTSRETKAEAEKLKYVKAIEEAGGLVVADTCMVVAPLEEMGYKRTGVNSGKAASYLPSFCGQKVRFSDVEELL
ncbi:MAG: aconitase X catalytic domain-containing protein [Candidatus ainarchaeum sp.]|nr:aconitase X catalytic domain-containing protein [Candidatus ainarchaeum sp.]